MAVLNKIRQRSVILILVIALALFSFVLADVIRNGGMISQKSQNTIASVNGEDLDREQFARQVEAYQRNMGPNASSSQAVNMVWNMNLREMLLEEQFDELGIRVEEAQVKNLLRQQLAGDPTFSNEAGMFDENKLEEYVATIKATSPVAYQQWVDFENSVAKSAREQIYFNMVKAGIGATLLEGEQAYRHANDNVDLKFVQVPYSSVPDSDVEVSKAEIKDYMEKHPERFQTEASRSIQFVHFPEEASAEDEQEVKENLSALLENRVEFNAVTNANDTISGFKNTDNIENFVNENSDTKYVEGFVFKDELSGENADTLFNLQQGQIYGPYQDQGSWKLSKMLEVSQLADSARARHILIAYQGSPIGAGISRSKADAKTLADSLVNIVRQDTTQFAPLALQYSADPSNKQNAGELGWFSPGMMVPEFNDFIFQGKEGQIGVVETELGYHVVEIQDLTEKEKAVKIATIVREIQPSEKSMNDLFAEVTKFEIAAGDGKFVEVAKEHGKEVRQVKEMKVLDENIPGIGAQRQIVQWAFEEDAEVGDIKRFDIADGYVIAQLTDIHKEGLQSVEAASTTVLPILQKRKKAEIIKEKITGSSLEEIAKNQGEEINTANSVNLNSPVLPGAGNEPKVVGVAFALEAGEKSEPIAGESGVFVVEVISKNEAPALDSYRPYANRETLDRRTAVNAEVFEALKEEAEIEDNRARFY
ncbi:MAG TPA: peptidylprolyl isomerase [Salinimicrobium sp.]|nr:peptidylprolyl isomerase [Salinimicrobium sp.]